MSFYEQSHGHGRSRDFILGGRVEILRAGGRCHVCGDLSGNCTGNNHDTPVINWESSDDLKTHYVEEDVFVAGPQSGQHATRVILAQKGTWITKRRARELGLI